MTSDVTSVGEIMQVVRNVVSAMPAESDLYKLVDAKKIRSVHIHARTRCELSINICLLQENGHV